MAGVIRRFESDSKPGRFYEVQRAADGSLYCSCPKWKFQKGIDPKERSCKHIEAVLEDEKRAKVQAKPAVQAPPFLAGVSIREILEAGKKPPEKSKAPRRRRAYWSV